MALCIVCRGLGSHPSSSFFIYYGKRVQVSCISLSIYVGLRFSIIIIIIFLTVHHSINVLNVSTCTV